MESLLAQHVLSYLELEDVARLSSLSRGFRRRIKLADVRVAHADLLRFGRAPRAAAAWFRRVLDAGSVRALTIELDPYFPQRAVLLNVLRAFTHCVTHEGGAGVAPFGYASGLQRLRFCVSAQTVVPEGFVARSHQLFEGSCCCDQSDEKRLYCVCVDWSETCIHRNKLVRRRSLRLEPHRNWMCSILKSDWYNIFRWFPNLIELEVPLSSCRTQPRRVVNLPSELLKRAVHPVSSDTEYMALIEFMFPRLVSRGPSCDHPGLCSLTLTNASDHTLLIDEQMECEHSAARLENLSISSIVLSRKTLGSFTRSVLAARVVDHTLVVEHLRNFRLYTAAGASNFISLVEEADNRYNSRELYCRLALAFSTLVATRSDSDDGCDTCGLTECRLARIRGYAPLRFEACASLSIDVCSLLAQEDLHRAFPKLQRLSCLRWMCEEDPCVPAGESEVEVNYRFSFGLRLISLLSRLRSVALIEIQQDFPIPTDCSGFPNLDGLHGAASVQHEFRSSRVRAHIVAEVLPTLLKKIPVGLAGAACAG